MIDSPDTYSAEVIVNGTVHKLETTDDLNLYRSIIASGFEWTMFKTPEDQQKIINLVSAYEQEGSPALRKVDHRMERIQREINMAVFLGGRNPMDEPRFDTPGSYGIDP